MVLVETNCISELAALDIRFHIFKPEGIRLRPATLIKKRKTGALPKEFFRAYPHDKRLCLVECLRYYETCTNQFWCNRTVDIESRLFPSHVKPHKPVTSQRIAHWVKDLLQQAGIDTNIFKAHSRADHLSSIIDALIIIVLQTLRICN